MVNIISISEHTQLLIGPSTGVTFKVAVNHLFRQTVIISWSQNQSISFTQ